MKRIELASIPTSEKQGWLQHAVAPRPICFASTVNKEGAVNLSPFSFFNLFSTQPPILVFSPSRRLRDNSVKHTLTNMEEVPEVTINIVDVQMVQQVSLASCEYPKHIDEFVKAGFTALKSEIVRPPRVAESKVQMECRVVQIIPLGHEGGSGNLALCEVLIMHVAEDILNEAGTMIDHRKLHHAARLGGNWYSKVDEQSIFQVEKPNVHLGIGFDQLPDSIRRSRNLTGNQLGQLANVTRIPEAEPAFYDPHVKEIVQYFSNNPDEMEIEMHRYAGRLLDQGKVAEAWQVLLMY
jgi:flavin reductase (DIM6/NTAB) family NADH-FMN oxidoreductase RutF